MITLCRVYNFARVNSIALFLMISSLVTPESCKTPPSLYDVRNFVSVDFQNYKFFHILSRVIFVWMFVMESQIYRIPVCIWPFKNKIGILVFEDSRVDNLLPEFNLSTILDGITQCHVSWWELLCQIYWVIWHWSFVDWNITVIGIVINSWPLLAFKLSAILYALAF